MRNIFLNILRTSFFINIKTKRSNNRLNHKTMSKQQFWDKQAKRYDKLVKLLTGNQYKAMYKFIKAPLTKDMTVLEVATGTGLVAKEIADRVKSIEATDFSEKMIATAKKSGYASNINFSYADMFDLPFEENQFDTVIASNVLHIIPHPEKAMAEIKRVLKPGGLLIAPTFLWKKLSLFRKIQKFFMILKKFPLNAEWNEETFKNFINDNGFTITKFQTIKSNFTIGCVVAKVKS